MFAFFYTFLGVPGTHHRLLRIHTESFEMPWSNRSEDQTNLWLVPIDVVTDYTPSGFVSKLNGVNNVTSMHLELVGSSNINLISDVLHGGFHFDFNDLFEKEDMKEEAGCDADLVPYYNRAGK